MAYNYFPNNYQPQQFYPTQPNANPTQMGVGGNQVNAQTAMIWVQGEAGAKSYLVAPNSTVTLWDTESQTIYIKSADSSGMPTMKVLDYTMRGGAPEIQKIPPQSGFVTKDDFDALKEEFVHLKEKVSTLGKE